MRKVIIKLVVCFMVLLILIYGIIFLYFSKMTINIVTASYDSYGSTVPKNYSKTIDNKTFNSICVRIKKNDICSEKFEVNIDNVYVLKNGVYVNYTVKYLPYDNNGEPTFNSDFKGDPTYWKVNYKFNHSHFIVDRWIEDPTW